MITHYVTVYNSLLYFVCLLLFGCFILNQRIAKGWLVVAGGLFAILAVCALWKSHGWFYNVLVISLVAQFWLLKRIFKDVRLSVFLFVFVAIWLVNLLLLSLITLVIPCSYWFTDCAVNTTTTGVLALLCVTPLRNRLQQIIELTPKYVFIMSAAMLLFAAITSGLISGFESSDFPEVWTQFLQITISFLLLVICTVIPVIFMISISNTRLKAATEEYEQQIRVQADYYKELAKANYETRRFRHDLKNMHIALEQLLKEGKCQEALGQLHLQDEAIRHTAAQFDTGNSFADALLSHKQARAERADTQLRFQGALSPNTPEPTDLCVILGNTLDNALEACEKLDGKKVISVSAMCRSGFLFLTIQNPAPGPVAVRGGTVATTKENKTLHGFGLYSLNAVVRKYDGTLRLSSEQDRFTAEIELCLLNLGKRK